MNFDDACDGVDKFNVESVPSIKEGYCPHDDMDIFRCSRCGGTVFESFPQSVALDAPVWTYEYHCVRCGLMMGLTCKRD